MAATATQKYRLIAIETPLGEDVLLLTRMMATDSLSRLFEYEVELLSKKSDISFDEILGQNATVRLQTVQGETRYFNGFVSRFSQAGTQREYYCYRATLSPWLWFLTRTSDCRIFQEKTVPDIIKEVFRDHGFSDFEESLSKDYRTWEYCVQYRETDFNFVSRLMENEGIYYYFKHENGKHTLVMADGSHDTIPGYEEIPYFPPDEHDHRERDHIFGWEISQEIHPGRYALNDFDFKAPKKSLRTARNAARGHAQASFEVYDYPGEYVEMSDGEAYADSRINELHSQFEVAHGQGSAAGITAGFLFSLADYPRDDQNRKYLVTSVNHELANDEYMMGSGGGGPVYECSFTVINAEQMYRPARVARKTFVQGPQTAVVVGPAGEEIYTDEHGRVKVQFHWDRYGEANENSSCWIRVAQVWAGKRWGAMYIPRIGQEVIVDFLEGDPDKPIITGRVYNGDNVPPYALPDNKTMSTLKSNSSKGGGGFNEIRFEDKKGDEQIFMHAQKNQDVRVLNDCFEWIGNNRHLVVKTDQFEHVQNNRSEKVDADHKEEIGKDRHLKVAGKEAKEVVASQSLTVKGDVVEVFKANHSEQTTGDYYLKASNIVIEATSNITLKVGGSYVAIDASGVGISGPQINVDGKGSVELKGGGTAKLEGGATAIVKGGIVMIN